MIEIIISIAITIAIAISILLIPIYLLTLSIDPNIIINFFLLLRLILLTFSI